MLGKTVYYLNFKDKVVGEGVVIEAHISTGGYESYIIETPTGDVQMESIICYPTREKAEKALAKKQPLSDRMNDLAKKTTAKIDKMRTQLLGEPKLKHLARK